MHDEPGFSSRDEQPINVDAPDHVVLSYVVWTCPVESLMLERMMKIPISDTLSRTQLLEENFSVEPPLQSSQPSEPPLPLSTKTNHHPTVREKRARETVNFECSSCSFPVKQLWHSVCAAWSLLACQRDNWEDVGVEVSYPVTAGMFEDPEDDWLATASSRARARVKVNMKKLSSDERAQFRAAQGKEMDQWISNDSKE